MSNLGEILKKPEACDQTVLLDMSLLKGQKLMENAKFGKVKCNIFSNFQTMWNYWIIESRNFVRKWDFFGDFQTMYFATW